MSCAWPVSGSGSADAGAPEPGSSDFPTSPSTFVTCAEAVCETSTTAAINSAAHGRGASDRFVISSPPGAVVRHGSGASKCCLALPVPHISSLDFMTRCVTEVIVLLAVGLLCKRRIEWRISPWAGAGAAET